MILHTYPMLKTYKKYCNLDNLPNHFIVVFKRLSTCAIIRHQPLSDTSHYIRHQSLYQTPAIIRHQPIYHTPAIISDTSHYQTPAIIRHQSFIRHQPLYQTPVIISDHQPIIISDTLSLPHHVTLSFTYHVINGTKVIKRYRPLFRSHYIRHQSLYQTPATRYYQTHKLW